MIVAFSGYRCFSKYWLLLSDIWLMTNLWCPQSRDVLNCGLFYYWIYLQSVIWCFVLVFEASLQHCFHGMRTDTGSMLITAWSKPKGFLMCTCYIRVITGSNVSCNLCCHVELLVYKMPWREIFKHDCTYTVYSVILRFSHTKHLKLQTWFSNTDKCIGHLSEGSVGLLFK